MLGNPGFSGFPGFLNPEYPRYHPVTPKEDKQLHIFLAYVEK